MRMDPIHLRKEANEVYSFIALPQDIQKLIFSLLRINELFYLRVVSKEMRQLAHEFLALPERQIEILEEAERCKGKRISEEQLQRLLRLFGMNQERLMGNLCKISSLHPLREGHSMLFLGHLKISLEVGHFAKEIVSKLSKREQESLIDAFFRWAPHQTWGSCPFVFEFASAKTRFYLKDVVYSF